MGEKSKPSLVCWSGDFSGTVYEGIHGEHFLPESMLFKGPAIAGDNSP